MADDGTTKQVAGIQKRLGKKKKKSTAMFSDFSARPQSGGVDKDATLRELLTNLRLKWREQHADVTGSDLALVDESETT